MDEFLFTLSFSIVPLITVNLFALVAPPLGATLSLRNEILLGIALPPVGSAVIAGAIFFGVSPDAIVLLYLLAAISIFLVMIVLPLNVGKKRISLRRRELILAALFCIGNTLVMVLMSISPRVEAHFRNLLQGELLAVTGIELTATAILTIILIVFGFLFRGVIYGYSLDEEGLRITEKSYTTITLSFRAVATLVITGGIILIGPLLTTSLLIVPAFLTERSCRGLDRFMVVVMGVGFFGSLLGFLLAVVTDLPPAPVSVCVIIAVGYISQLLFGRQ